MAGKIPWTTKVLVVTLGVAVAASTMALATRGDDYRFFDPLIDVKAIIDRFAVEKPDAEKLQRAAIEGMLSALDDPYALYVPAENEADFNQQLTGEYVGIGAEVQTKEGVLEIVTPLDGSPAFKSGVMAGDRVLEIDGQSTQGETARESIKRIKGDAGTTVNLLIERDGKRLEIPVVRDEIRTPAVKGVHRHHDSDATWDFILDPDRKIAYIRLTQFTPSCADEIIEAVKAAEEQAGGTLGGLVLDLRFNPGGVLDQAIRIADFFLHKGTIVSTRGPAHPEFVAEAHDQPTDRDFPIAILINSQSASASEVLSGALTENGRAIAVGTRSYGKGSVQSVRSLTGEAAGSVLKLTEQRYYLPTGRSIQRLDNATEWGVDPTPGFYIPMSDEETVAMLDVWRQEDIIDASSDADDRDWADPAYIRDTLRDPQLAEALRATQTRVDRGDWEPIGDTAPAVNPAILGELASAKLARERLLRELSRIDKEIETMQTASAADPEAQSKTDIDLIPDDAELVGGELEVRDATGRLVRTLRITDENLERWLIDAGVKPLDDAGAAQEKATDGAP